MKKPSPPKRNPTQKTVTISLGTDLLERIDQRAKVLEMDRSSFIRWCVKLELGLIVTAPTSRRHMHANEE
jgi:metal-responsive CopG/Arc/MetJ family transcriptional regulator